MTERTAYKLSERMAYSVNEVCALLGVSVPTVYARINDGSLRSSKFGTRRLILRADVEALFVKQNCGSDMGCPEPSENK
jgi:excisionase family DNA binding protein